MKSLYLVLGTVAVVLAALLSPPLMTRFWDERQLALATGALLAHSLMGVLDFFKPIVVRRVVNNPNFATFSNVLAPSLAISIVLAALCAFLGSLYLPDYYVDLVFTVSACVFLCGIYFPIWGVLDGSMMMAETYLVRSFSVAFLYIALGVGALFGRDEVIYLSLITANLIPCVIFYLMSRRLFVANQFSLDSLYFKEVVSVFIQNFARAVVDYGDRVLAVFLIPTGQSGSYLILSDLASRANFFTKIVADQYYPILCQNRGRSGNFLVFGLFCTAAFILSTLAFVLYGVELYVWYLGEGVRDFFWVFGCLLVAFGVQTLGRFAQVVLRSRSMDRSLTLSLMLPVLCCSIYFLSYKGEFGIREVVLLMVASKSGAFIMMLRLLRIHPILSVIGMILCVFSWMSVFYIIYN